MFLLLQERQVGDKLPPTGKCDNLSRFENAHFLVPACGVFLEKSFRVPKNRLLLIVRAHWAR